MYRVCFLRQPKNFLKKLRNEKEKRRILSAIVELRKNPREPRLDVKKMAGTKGGYRLRIGDWRIIYTIDHNNTLVIVAWLGQRGDAYEGPPIRWNSADEAREIKEINDILDEIGKGHLST